MASSDTPCPPPLNVQAGKELDLPVFYGDAGSPAVLHSVRAHHAKCAVITLNTPGANYRAVWALNKVPKVLDVPSLSPTLLSCESLCVAFLGFRT